MGRPPVITRDRVAEVALQIIDEEGIEALSLERIANEIGVKAPSLYHHFADKAAILTEVAKLVLGDLDLTRPTDDWQQWMVDNVITFYRRVLDHPRAATVLLQFLPDASTIPGMGHAARMLTQMGVEPSVQILIMEGCEKLAWGWALQRAFLELQTDVRISPARINRRWPELAVALRDSRWRDEELLETSIRAFLRGVVEPATP
jgi:AcrR family transcriptional regulator